MNTPIKSTLVILTVAVFFGCASPRKGPAYNHQAEFRQQLAQSIPVKEYGYAIKDLRFTQDYQRALVIFSNPTNRPAMEARYQRPDWEVVLESDGFGRYRGMAQEPFYTPGRNTLPVPFTVTLPQN